MICIKLGGKTRGSRRFNGTGGMIEWHAGVGYTEGTSPSELRMDGGFKHS